MVVCKMPNDGNRRERPLIAIRVTVLAALLALPAVAAPARAASSEATGIMYYASCMTAADIMEGRPPPSDPQADANQLDKAAMCFGAVTAIANLEPFLKPEFALCPPKGSTISYAQMILVIAAYLRNHPERLNENFHTLAVLALNSSWPCLKP
jgi:hypothetical protein